MTDPKQSNVYIYYHTWSSKFYYEVGIVILTLQLMKLELIEIM